MNLKNNWPLAIAWLALALGLFFATHQAKGGELCASITQHGQVPIFYDENGEVWLDCESAQWLEGMNPRAHLGPVSDGFIDPPTCTYGGDGFNRDENALTWMHDHGGLVPQFGGDTIHPTGEYMRPDNAYHFQCPEVANPNWSKYGHRTHTYNTSDGLVLQGRNGSWCVDEPETPCNPDDTVPIISHQQHRGPIMCQVKRDHFYMRYTAHVTSSSNPDFANGVPRVRYFFYDEELGGSGGKQHLITNQSGLVSGATELGQRVSYVVFDGTKDTTWVAMKEICIEIGTESCNGGDPDFDKDGAVMVSDFINGFMPLYRLGLCSTVDFVDWFLPAFMAETGN